MDAGYILIGVIVAILYLCILGVSIADYIIRALGVYKIAQKRALSNPWLAWVPVANSWIFGNIVDDFESEKGSKRKFRVILLTLSIVMWVLAILTMIMFAVVIEQFWIYGEYMTESEELFLYMCLYAPMIPLMVVLNAEYIVGLICLHKVYEYICPEKSIKYTVISLLLFPLGLSICLFMNAKRCPEKTVFVPDSPVVESPPEVPQEEEVQTPDVQEENETEE